MIHIRNLQDLSIIQGDTELWRECYGFLSACAKEIREYGDEEDLADHDFNMFILSDHDLDYINDLGPPEETVVTRIECCGEIRVFHRLVYPTEIVILEKSPQ